MAIFISVLTQHVPIMNMKKILVIDDDADILEVVQETLIYEQFEVQTVNQSKNVLPVAAIYRPDLILMDYRLGDGDGGQICRELKQHPVFRSVPVILFSAYIHAATELMAYGCDAVISKPFDLTDLIDTINRLTRRH